MSLEGELRISLRADGGQIGSVDIASTRPEIARLLLQGRTPSEAAAAVPALFSLCGHSQATACALACTAAAGEEADAATLAASSAEVQAEIVRETAWRLLLDWPRWIGETPGDEAIAAARRASVPAAAPSGAGADSVALAVFGMPAGDWLALQSLPELTRWADRGTTAAARFIHQLRDDEARWVWLSAPQPAAVPLLPAAHHTAWMPELAQAALADPGFARRPLWHGAAAETGALARLQSDPLLSALARQGVPRLQARFVARLRELALLLAQRASVAVGALALPDRRGVAWVENARGLLVHLVQIDGARLADYRIVAPTEWNFHPAGALAQALSGSPASDREAVLSHTLRLVHSLDPCVVCRVEFEGA